MFKFNKKSLKKFTVISASALMLLGVGSTMSSAKSNVHAETIGQAMVNDQKVQQAYNNYTDGGAQGVKEHQEERAKLYVQTDVDNGENPFQDSRTSALSHQDIKQIAQNENEQNQPSNTETTTTTSTTVPSSETESEKQSFAKQNNEDQAIKNLDNSFKKEATKDEGSVNINHTINKSARNHKRVMKPKASNYKKFHHASDITDKAKARKRVISHIKTVKRANGRHHKASLNRQIRSLKRQLRKLEKQINEIKNKHYSHSYKRVHKTHSRR